jgi:hypothetical protein
MADDIMQLFKLHGHEPIAALSPDQGGQPGAPITQKGFR